LYAGLYAAGCGSRARFRGVVEEHLEALPPSAQHHPIGLDLLEARIPYDVPDGVRMDAPPLDVF
jgi:hypothetical protein